MTEDQKRVLEIALCVALAPYTTQANRDQAIQYMQDVLTGLKGAVNGRP